ncbi:hypothetical protein EXN66_Car005685 [Channa argus]|uniref:Uncharacterized protein n=1 Tax=Channa argus TaxID=215402 RepID=A0A6G1PII8_CHAAH|nr:hypothetical protein EXN66_Car005685 [Channa argus]
MEEAAFSLKFYSHLAPSTPNKFSVHTALCIAIETSLLITTETSFPAPDKESSLPVRPPALAISKPHLFLQAVPTSRSKVVFTPPLLISTFPTFLLPVA